MHWARHWPLAPYEPAWASFVWWTAIIEEHNLKRHTLFDEDDIAADLPKAVAAVEKLRHINRQVTVEPVVADVTPTNIEGLISDCDLILGSSDNFELRMLLNDACVKHSIPWIYGAASPLMG